LSCSATPSSAGSTAIFFFREAQLEFGHAVLLAQLRDQHFVHDRRVDVTAAQTVVARHRERGNLQTSCGRTSSRNTATSHVPPPKSKTTKFLGVESSSTAQARFIIR